MAIHTCYNTVIQYLCYKPLSFIIFFHQRLSIDADEAMAISQKRNKQLFEVIQQNVQSSDPVWKVKPLQIEKQSPGASVKDDVE